MAKNRIGLLEIVCFFNKMSVFLLVTLCFLQQSIKELFKQIFPHANKYFSLQETLNTVLVTDNSHQDYDLFSLSTNTKQMPLILKIITLFKAGFALINPLQTNRFFSDITQTKSNKFLI